MVQNYIEPIDCIFTISTRRLSSDTHFSMTTPAVYKSNSDKWDFENSHSMKSPPIKAQQTNQFHHVRD
jgi:hypothetical protein